ncbi:MAG: long-chain-fatty-acid--CoA ligase [Frankia sp.]
MASHREPAAHYPRLRTLQDTVAFHAEHRPDHPAILCDDRRITYAELHRESNRWARAILASGVGPGSRVAYLGKESEHYYRLLFACAKSETVLVPINWRLTAVEVGHILRDSTARLLFVESDFRGQVDGIYRDLARPPALVCTDARPGDDRSVSDWCAEQSDEDLNPRTDGDEAVAQIYTSGTTGLPKGVVLAHRSFFRIRDALAAGGLDWIDWHIDDVSLIGIPGFHVGGLWWATQGFNAGITNVVMRAFAPRAAIDLIRARGVTTACVVPAMLQMMVAEPGVVAADFRSLRKVVYGGAPISERLLKECITVIGCDFAQIYGLTETGNTAVCLPPSAHVIGSPRLKAAGRPYPGVDIRIVDPHGRRLADGTVGEVCIRTPARMLRYWKQPIATSETLVEGWILTGDAGYLDQDGFLYISDRIKDTVIVAGENVYPAEIENALTKHPAVLEAAAVGVPHELWGETVRAFVAFRNGHTASPRELTVFLRAELAAYKIPTGYEFVESVPRNPSGKIMRRLLREKYWQGMERRVN